MLDDNVNVNVYICIEHNTSKHYRGATLSSLSVQLSCTEKCGGLNLHIKCVVSPNLLIYRVS